MKLHQLAACLLTTVAIGAYAQSKTLRIVVPYPPGGSPDNLARVIGEKLQSFGTYTVVVENRPGAGGAVAVAAVKNAPPDGNTVLLADSSTYSIGPVIKKNPPYDPLKDLRAVGQAATSPIFMVARPDVASVKDLITKLKSGPPKAYGSSGHGTAHHLAMELFKATAGVEMTHVPYKGSAHTVPAVASGEVFVTFAGLTNANSFAQAGKVKVLAIAEPKRSQLAPDVPTLAESGLPHYNITISLGLLMVANAPDAAVQQLNTALNRAVSDEDVRRRLISMGVEVQGSTPEQFAKQIAVEQQRFAEISRKAGIQDE